MDGDFQTYKAKDGAFLREHFFGKYPELLELVKDYTDEQLIHLHRGGHDPVKVYNAYKRAVEHKGGPTVVLAKTVKGYGMGTAQARNATHNEKKLTDDALAAFVKQFDIPIPEEAAKDGHAVPAAAGLAGDGVHAGSGGAELGGYLPMRSVPESTFKAPELELLQGVDGAGRAGARFRRRWDLCRILRAAAEGPGDRQAGGADCAGRGTDVWAGVGDSAGGDLCAGGPALHAARQGHAAVLSRGAGRADSGGRDYRGGVDGFVYGGGQAYSTYKVPMIPFYMYYSMFGFQRIGDMVWAFADSRGKGFLMGGTAGRTTMLGEGLQHQDGHSHVLASTVPTCVSYDPALCVRAGGGAAGRHAADVREQAKTASTTSRCTTRTMRCRRCRRARRKGFCGASTSSGRRRPKGEATVQLFGVGTDSERGAAGAGDSGGEVPDCRRCVERDQLYRAAARGDCDGALEPVASGGRGEEDIHRDGAGRREGADRRGERLHEVAAGCAGSVAARMASAGW